MLKLIHQLMSLDKIIPKWSFRVRGGRRGQKQSVRLVGGREEWLTKYNNQEGVLPEAK